MNTCAAMAMLWRKVVSACLGAPGTGCTGKGSCGHDSNCLHYPPFCPLNAAAAPLCVLHRTPRYYGPHLVCGLDYWNVVDAVAKYVYVVVLTVHMVVLTVRTVVLTVHVVVLTAYVVVLTVHVVVLTVHVVVLTVHVVVLTVLAPCRRALVSTTHPAAFAT